MEAASAAARTAGLEGADDLYNNTFHNLNLSPPIDTEGSIHFRRHRRRRSGLIEYTGYSSSRTMEEVNPLWPRLLIC
eukprot:scaffold13538_cov72-Cyclotella_meneghiniana.AAC.7